MARGEINPIIGITDGKMRTLLKSALRPIWRNTSRKRFIQAIRHRGTNPKTGRGWFAVTCVDCGREMGVSEKERRTKKDGTLEKRAKSVYEVDHINGITPMTDIKDTLGEYYHDLIYGDMRILCVACHKKHTFDKKKS
jgi:hypothetical protein